MSLSHYSKRLSPDACVQLLENPGLMPALKGPLSFVAHAQSSTNSHLNVNLAFYGISSRLGPPTLFLDAPKATFVMRSHFIRRIQVHHLRSRGRSEMNVGLGLLELHATSCCNMPTKTLSTSRSQYVCSTTDNLDKSLTPRGLVAFAAPGLVCLGIYVSGELALARYVLALQRMCQCCSN